MSLKNQLPSLFKAWDAIEKIKTGQLPAAAPKQPLILPPAPRRVPGWGGYRPPTRGGGETYGPVLQPVNTGMRLPRNPAGDDGQGPLINHILPV